MMATAFKTIKQQDDDVSIINAKKLYFDLLKNTDALANLTISADLIEQHIAENDLIPSPIPQDMNQLESWLEDHNEYIGECYQKYLNGRKAGEPRLYFRNKAHALYFIRAVAPTKLVDGSWLYGLAKHWQDQRLSSLIKIYLEELGDGIKPLNHVLLYQHLLKTEECDDWMDLPEPYFTQGAIQLSLANNSHDYLPEILGFNLAYEQLPLHLLITAYELNELNIDPYYFTLHVTIDNAQTGHAHSAIKAVRDSMPLFGDQKEFCRRVVNGSKLNNVGLGTLEIIESFDLQDELIRILQKKAILGRHLHSDRCVLETKTINEWLSDPQNIPEFLLVMQKNGWINRHTDPVKSRFWTVISGERAPMFGVFSNYERQIIFDWIAGDALDSLSKQEKLGKPWRLKESVSTSINEETMVSATNNRMNIIEIKSKKQLKNTDEHLLNDDIHTFESYANSIGDINERACLFLEWMSPSKHHTSIGLLATRKFKNLFNARPLR